MKAATTERHPLGSHARVLLTSVFGPYAQDDEYGSRAINPMELFHNQVTRVQGAFSLRMFHRSWGLMLLQANIGAPCTLLDFPTQDRFVQELRDNPYDIIGISAIIPNIGKVKRMCALIRRYQPNATIVVGGHIANVPCLDDRIDADHIVRGEGVGWFRRFLGQDDSEPIRHPRVLSGHGARTMGMTLREKRGDVAATLIPSVGCPMGCNFCSTSAMFGGKGKFFNFYETGDELFDIMCQLENGLRVRSFFVMDENFLLHRKRALRLLELMVQHHKSWALHVFSSANVLRAYTIEQLVGLGVSWVWMGLEGRGSEYAKLHGTDTVTLVRELQSHGIRVLGSSIIGLLEHTPENIDEAIDHAVSHDTDFHQFMLYTPIPGTPLYAEHLAGGTLLGSGEVEEADIHGQLKFNYRHPHIKDGRETEFLLRAFQRDFDVNGPSILRTVRTTLAGWKRYKHHPDRRIRDRYAWEARDLPLAYAGGLWAARRWFKSNPAVSARIAETLSDIRRVFGVRVTILAPLIGRIILHKLRQESRRLSRSWTYEPPTFYEKNDHAALQVQPNRSMATPVRWAAAVAVISQIAASRGTP
jgi:radical SAM superfamily enzyme YgiQ (UPF0313 family)